jgi:DNA adenine methylase
MRTPFLSPLRYPGGKRKLAKFMKLLFSENGLLDGEYVEPYAGGASIALALLYGEYARRVHINDLDRAVYAFWHSVLHETEMLCRLVYDTPVTMEEWHKQKAIQGDAGASLISLGFSTFFLNRTNRSGIISGGVIGGKGQAGRWSLDARYNKENLVARIEKVARYKHRICLYNLDAADFIRSVFPRIPNRSLVYLDPPYFVKGQQLLYKNYYEPVDHGTVAELVRSIQQYWVVSYDDMPQIRILYKGYRHLSYSLHYSAQDRYRGAEVMFFCDKLKIPSVLSQGRATSVRFGAPNEL